MTKQKVKMLISDHDLSIKRKKGEINKVRELVEIKKKENKEKIEN